MSMNPLLQSGAGSLAASRNRFCCSWYTLQEPTRAAATELKERLLEKVMKCVFNRVRVLEKGFEIPL